MIINGCFVIVLLWGNVGEDSNFLLKAFLLSGTDEFIVIVLNGQEEVTNRRLAYYCFIYLNRLSMIYVTILHEEHNLRLSKGFLGLFRTLQVASSGLFPCWLRYMYRDCWVADLLWLDTLRIYQSSTAYILRSLMSFFFRGVWWVAGVF